MKSFPEFYRCYQCNRITAMEFLQAGGGCSCGSVRFRPAHNLSLTEEIGFIFRHPSAIKFVFRRAPGVA